MIHCFLLWIVVLPSTRRVDGLGFNSHSMTRFLAFLAINSHSMTRFLLDGNSYLIHFCIERSWAFYPSLSFGESSYFFLVLYTLVWRVFSSSSGFASDDLRMPMSDIELFINSSSIVMCTSSLCSAFFLASNHLYFASISIFAAASFDTSTQ